MFRRRILFHFEVSMSFKNPDENEKRHSACYALHLLFFDPTKLNLLSIYIPMFYDQLSNFGELIQRNKLCDINLIYGIVIVFVNTELDSSPAIPKAFNVTV